jgi:uncharacterized Ntn-hydrolase superfamily protein
MLGVAVSSKFVAVGAICSYTRTGVGAIASQAYGNPYLGIDGLDLLEQGLAAEAVRDKLLQADAGREKRQVIIIDKTGQTAVFTGIEVTDWCGHHQGNNYSVAGNMLTGERVLAAMARAFEKSIKEELAERLLQALEAGQQAGGDRRGKQAAHLQVVHTEAWKYVDLRVDEHPDPVKELRRIFEVAKQELFPLRNLYPTRKNPGGDWNMEEYKKISLLVAGK